MVIKRFCTHFKKQFSVQNQSGGGKFEVMN